MYDSSDDEEKSTKQSKVLSIQFCSSGLIPTLHSMAGNVTVIRLCTCALAALQRVLGGRAPVAGGGRAVKRRAQGGTWIKEGGEEEPVNFLDPAIVKRVVGQFSRT